MSLKYRIRAAARSCAVFLLVSMLGILTGWWILAAIVGSANDTLVFILACLGVQALAVPFSERFGRLALHSRDLFLIAYTPLTYLRYTIRNLVRHLTMLLAVWVAIPLAMALIIVRWMRLAPHWPFDADSSRAFAVNTCLLWWIFLIVPIYEDHYRRSWTRMLLLPRHLPFLPQYLISLPRRMGGLYRYALFLARHPRAILFRMPHMAGSNRARRAPGIAIFAVYALLLGLFFLRRYVPFDPVLDAKLKALLFEGGPGGALVHWLISPLTATWVICRPGSTHGDPWALAGLQGALIVCLGSAIAYRWRRSQEDLEANAFEGWTGIRDRIESASDAVEIRRQRLVQARLPVNYLDDLASEPASGSAMTAMPAPPSSSLTPARSIAIDELARRSIGNSMLPDPLRLAARRVMMQEIPRTRPLPARERRLDYDETLEPERQMHRHQDFWRKIHGRVLRRKWRRLSLPSANVMRLLFIGGLLLARGHESFYTWPILVILPCIIGVWAARHLGMEENVRQSHAWFLLPCRGAMLSRPNSSQSRLARMAWDAAIAITCMLTIHGSWIVFVTVLALIYLGSLEAQLVMRLTWLYDISRKKNNEEWMSLFTTFEVLAILIPLMFIVGVAYSNDEAARLSVLRGTEATLLTTTVAQLARVAYLWVRLNLGIRRWSDQIVEPPRSGPSLRRLIRIR